MRSTFAVFLGVTLIVLGVLFFLDNLGYLDANRILDNFWPVLLIIGGLVLALRGPRLKEGVSDSIGTRIQATAEDRVSVSAVFGNLSRKIVSHNFAGGDCSVVFGDIRLDLTAMELSEGEHVLRASSVFGGALVELPDNIEFSVRANHVFGSMEVNGAKKGGMFQSLSFRSKGFETAEKRLSIDTSLVFGNVIIRQRF